MNKYRLTAIAVLTCLILCSEPILGNKENGSVPVAAKEKMAAMHDEEGTGSEGELLIVPVPSLVSVLIQLEAEKGEPLTEEEVLEARDNAASVAMPRHAQRAVEESRGYTDIDPENVWLEWLEYKANRK